MERPSVSTLLAERFGETPIFDDGDRLPDWATHVVFFFDDDSDSVSRSRNMPFANVEDAELVAKILRKSGHSVARVLKVTSDYDRRDYNEDAREDAFANRQFEQSQEMYR